MASVKKRLRQAGRVSTVIKYASKITATSELEVHLYQNRKNTCSKECFNPDRGTGEPKAMFKLTMNGKPFDPDDFKKAMMEAAAAKIHRRRGGRPKWAAQGKGAGVSGNRVSLSG
jgi:hypothetical protein